MRSFLFETTLRQLGSATSNLTQKHKDIRYENNSKIKFSKAFINNERNYLQLEFLADSTFGGVSSAPRRKRQKTQLPTQYTLAIRFKGIKGFLPPNWERTNPKEKVKVLKNITDNCDVKFYSSGSDFFFQGAWEELDKRDLSIYQFPGPRGDGIWKGRHEASGGVSNGVYLTKHLSQLIDELDKFLPLAADSLTTDDKNVMDDPDSTEVDAANDFEQSEVGTEEEAISGRTKAEYETNEENEDFVQENDERTEAEDQNIEEVEEPEPDDNEDVLADPEMQEKIRSFRRQEENFLRSARRLIS